MRPRALREFRLDLVLSGDLVPAIAGNGQAIDFRSPAHGVVLHFSNYRLGSAGAGAGDVNGDGHSDVLVGEPGHDDSSMTDRGRVFAYYGSPAGLSTHEDWTLNGTQDDEWLGEALAPAGDGDGDGDGDGQSPSKPRAKAASRSCRE